MIQLTPPMRILVATEPTDFRRGIDGLARVCKEVLGHAPFAGGVFVFRSRPATALKILVYDGQGLWRAERAQVIFAILPGRGMVESHPGRALREKPPQFSLRTDHSLPRTPPVGYHTATQSSHDENRMISTPRMRLVPASVALTRAELTDRTELARLLSATVPGEWPPEILADALPLFLEWIEAAPDHVGWYLWYAMRRAASEASDMPAGDVGDILMASAGFKGPPQDGTVEIGYSVLPRFQGQGYATEMVRALIDWAFAQRGVARIVAETTEDNTPSMRLLHRLGFVRTEPAVEPGHVRFLLGGRGDEDLD